MSTVGSERARERIALLAVLVAATTAAIAPIWLARFLPLLDEPNHLSAIFIWSALSDPASRLHEFYEPNVVPVSYLLHYGLAFVFAKLVSVEVAHKLVLSLYVAGWPAAAYWFCRRTGRTPWLALTTLPLAFSTAWAHGYHPFNLGMVALLFGVCAHDRLLEQLNATGSARPAALARSWLLATLTSLACYFGHPLPLALLSLCAVVLWLAQGPRLMAALASASAFVPAYAAVIWQARAASLGQAEQRSPLGLPKDFPVLGLSRWLSRLRDLPEYAVNPLAGDADSRLFLGLSLLAIGLLIASVVLARRARRQAASETDAPSTPHAPEPLARQLRSLWLALALFALYLIAPEHLNEPVYMWILRGRVAPAIGFFLFLSPLIGPDSRLRHLPLFAAIALGLLSVTMTERYRDFDRTMQAFSDVMQTCPASAEVLTVRLQDDYPGLDVPVFRELASWVQVVHGGGYNPATFPRPIPFPFAEKRRLPAPHWRAHQQFGRVLNPRIFGCVLFLDFHGQLSPSQWTRAAESGPFQLWVSKLAAAR